MSLYRAAEQRPCLWRTDARHSPDEIRHSPDDERHSPDDARHSPDNARHHSPDDARHSPDDERHDLQYGVLQTVDEVSHRKSVFAHLADDDAERDAEDDETDDVRAVLHADREAGDAVLLLL